MHLQGEGSVSFLSQDSVSRESRSGKDLQKDNVILTLEGVQQ